MSVGQAGAAGGYLGLVEAIRQLTDDAGATAVPNSSAAQALPAKLRGGHVNG